MFPSKVWREWLKNKRAGSLVYYSTALLMLPPCVCFQKAMLLSTRDSCACWHLVGDQRDAYSVCASLDDYVGSWLAKWDINLLLVAKEITSWLSEKIASKVNTERFELNVRRFLFSKCLEECRLWSGLVN